MNKNLLTSFVLNTTIARTARLIKNIIIVGRNVKKNFGIFLLTNK